MGEREREREGGREKSVVFVCKMIRKNHRHARSVNIASQKKLVYSIYRDYQKSRTYALEEKFLNSECS